MKNKILLLAITGVLIGCGNNNDDFIDTPRQKEVTYKSFEDCKQDLSIAQCQSAIDNQQKQQDKSNAGFANRDNTVANPQVVDKSTGECDKEKKDSTEKHSDKCNTAAATSSSRGGVIYPVYGGSYAGNSSMGLQSSSSQPVNKSFSVTVPESTPTSHAATSRSIASSAKTTVTKPSSVSRGGIGRSGFRAGGVGGG